MHNVRKLLLSETFGTSVIVIAVVGSGAMADNLTQDLGLKLLINAISTILALFICISMFQKFSGSHFNPVVTANEYFRNNLSIKLSCSYIIAQFLGAFIGMLIANYMFDLNFLEISNHERSGFGLYLGEFIATFGLLFIGTFNRSESRYLIPLWIGSAYFFTSSTSFANPAVTFGRMFTDSFSGILPKSAFIFIFIQIITLLVFTLTTKKVGKSDE